MMQQNEGRMEELKKRAKRCRCKYCGGPLTIRRIVYGEVEDARVELFCNNCDRIEYGVEQEIYQAAEYFVDEIGYNAYNDLDENEKTRGMNISKVCEIIAWAYKNLGHLDRNGFTVPINVDKTLIGERLIIDEADLPEDF